MRILSAKHGVIGLDDVIEPYEMRLSAHGAPHQRTAWGDGVMQRMIDTMGAPGRVVLLAGVEYADAIGNPEYLRAYIQDDGTVLLKVKRR